MDKQKAIEAIHNLGGCDATEEWSKGYDAGITAALDVTEKMPDTDIRHGTWSDQKLFDDGFGGGRVGYICSACGKYVPCKGNYCSECGARMDLDSVTHDRCSNYMDCDGNCFIDDTPCDCNGNIEKCKGR
ncbi:MAG: hypothetical protein KBA55_16225 [Ruminococcus sp.]|nr:hypothetical protein [Ruminococcus sp.]